MPPVPYTRHQISEGDITSLVDVLRRGDLTQGPAVAEFEDKIAAYVGAKHAIAVNSGTAALHIAYLAAGMGPGSLTWTTPNTFVATANAARLCGAQVDFVDIDPDTFNISLIELERRLSEQKSASGPMPDFVVPVHFGGLPVDTDRLHELSAQYGFQVIEDAAHALGAEVDSAKVGACPASAVTIFSTHPAKIITTGEGGLCTTNSDDLASKLRTLRSHGVTRGDGTGPRPWEYQQHALGLNYRLPDINASLGISQLARIDTFLETRAKIADRYRKELQIDGVRHQSHLKNARSANHLYVIRIANQKRDKIFFRLKEADIHCQIHYIPVHTQPYHLAAGDSSGPFPEAEKYYEEAISLPMFPDLTEEEQGRVIRTIIEGLEKP